MQKSMIAFLMMCIALVLSGCGLSDSNINNYLASGYEIDDYATDIMPELKDLPKQENIDYQFYEKFTILGAPMSMLLVVTYDDLTYNEEKSKLDEKYSFLDHRVEAEKWPDTFLMPEYAFMIENYSFRVVAESDDNCTEYPKYFGMIATSDDKRKIAYLYFTDYDLDFISSPDVNHTMNEFVKENFRYNWSK